VDFVEEEVFVEEAGQEEVSVLKGMAGATVGEDAVPVDAEGAEVAVDSVEGEAEAEEERLESSKDGQKMPTQNSSTWSNNSTPMTSTVRREYVFIAIPTRLGRRLSRFPKESGTGLTRTQSRRSGISRKSCTEFKN